MATSFSFVHLLIILGVFVLAIAAIVLAIVATVYGVRRRQERARRGDLP